MTQVLESARWSPVLEDVLPHMKCRKLVNLATVGSQGLGNLEVSLHWAAKSRARRIKRGALKQRRKDVREVEGETFMFLIAT